MVADRRAGARWLLPLLWAATNRRRAVVTAFGGGGALLVGYVVAVGGDYFHGRFFVPALFAICAPLAAVPAQRRFAGLLLLVPWAIACLFVVRPVGLEPPTTAVAHLPNHAGKVTLEDFGWVEGEPRASVVQEDTVYVNTGSFIGIFEPADFQVAEDLEVPAISVGGIGLLGYGLGPGVHVVGHEKPLPAAWLAAEVVAPDTPVTPDQLFALDPPATPPLSG